MDYRVFIGYLIVMALANYAVRVIPFVLIKNKIENSFVKSFLYYIPYTVLTAMTFPAMFFATNHIASAAVGFLAAILTATRTKSLIIVALVTCATVLAVEVLLLI